MSTPRRRTLVDAILRAEVIARPAALRRLAVDPQTRILHRISTYFIGGGVLAAAGMALFVVSRHPVALEAPRAGAARAEAQASPTPAFDIVTQAAPSERPFEDESAAPNGAMPASAASGGAANALVAKKAERVDVDKDAKAKASALAEPAASSGAALGAVAAAPAEGAPAAGETARVGAGEGPVTSRNAVSR